ncbi:MAG: helix-turn-helix domain-containing protein, partial [Flavobacterium sp.]
FLNAERPRRNKEFTADGIEALKEYAWPGNVRELKRVCEQVSLVSPLPFIRKEDVRGLLKQPATASVEQSVPDPEEHELSRGLNDLVADFEARIIRASMKNISDVEELAKFLKISLPTLDSYTKQGKIIAYRIGTKIRYKVEDLNKSLSKINFK